VRFTLLPQLEWIIRRWPSTPTDAVRPGGFLLFCNERLLGSDQPTWPLTEALAAFALGLDIGAGLPVTMKRRMLKARRATVWSLRDGGTKPPLS
jgi:hypothetical protein